MKVVSDAILRAIGEEQTACRRKRRKKQYYVRGGNEMAKEV